MALSGGSDFLKKLEEAKRLQELKEKQSAAFNNTSEIVKEEDTEVNELDDIKIEKSSSDKQKYVIFSISLILLFIITIVVLKVITKDDNKQQDELITQEQIMSKEFKATDNADMKEETPPKNIEKKLDISKIEQKEIPVEKKQKKIVKKIKKDPLDITKEKDFVPEIDIKKQKVKIKKLKEKNKKVKTRNEKKKLKINSLSFKPKGYFVQVGAFTKKPSRILLNRLKKVKMSYILYKTKVKGRYFTKVLVGPYKSRLSALDDLNMIRHITKNSDAFIIKF